MRLSDRIGRRMKLQDLHVLMTVVQAGSMNKAATELSTTQPAVSRSIADLEHALGVRLLDRHRSGIEPTAYGRALLDRCAAAFDELRQGVKKIEQLTNPTAGEVRIGASGALAAGFVSGVIDQLVQRYQDIVFHVEANDVYNELYQRNLDILVVRKSAATADDRVNFETLFSEAYVIAAGLRHPAAGRRRVRLAELAEERWAMPLPGTVAESIARQAFSASGIVFPSSPVIARPEVRLSLVAEGRFLSIFSEVGILRAQSSAKVLPIQLPTARVPSGIVTLKNRTLSPVAHLFIDAARKTAKQLATKN